MATKQTFKKEDEQLDNVNEALGTTSQWIEDHANLLTWIVVGVAAVVLGIIAINKYIIEPKGIEASNENAKAQVYFMQQNWEEALHGDDAECIGFEEIADEYHFYQEGKLAALYAGMCYYQLGDMESAASYIKRFSAKDVNIAPAAHQLLGDVYVELEDYDNAVSAFRAAAKSGNELIAPMSLKKAGLVYLLRLNDKEAAKHVFQTIKDDYPMSMEAQDIDKYIALSEAK